METVIVLFILVFFFFYSWLWWILDWMCNHCRDPPLLLPGLFLLDVSWGGAAVPHARGGLWERILTEKVLLRVWLPLPCHRGRRLRSYRLWELRDRWSVSTAFWTNPWKCRADTLDATLCRLTCCVCIWQLLKRNLLIISASTLCAPLETTPATFELFLPGTDSCSIFYVIWKWLTDSTLWFQEGWGRNYIKAFLLKDPPVTSCL